MNDSICLKPCCDDVLSMMEGKCVSRHRNANSVRNRAILILIHLILHGGRLGARLSVSFLLMSCDNLIGILACKGLGGSL